MHLMLLVRNLNCIASRLLLLPGWQCRALMALCARMRTQAQVRQWRAAHQLAHTQSCNPDEIANAATVWQLQKLRNAVGITEQSCTSAGWSQQARWHCIGTTVSRCS